MNHSGALVALCILLLQVSASLSQEPLGLIGLASTQAASESSRISSLHRGQAKNQQLDEDVEIGWDGDTRETVRGRVKREQLPRPTDVRTKSVLGEPVAKTAWIRCETEKSCTTSQQISHTVTLSSRKEISTEFSLVLFKVSGDVVDLSNATASGVSTSYSFTLDSPSEGRLMFTPKLVEISGRLNKSEFSLLAPKRTFSSNGIDHVDGIWWVQYKPDHEPIDDVNFYNIRHKDTYAEWGTDVGKLGTSSGSPRMCAESALKRGFNFAVWRNGGCWFKRIGDRRGRLMTGDAMPIGNYYLTIPGDKTVGLSHPEVRDEWVKQGECDLISEIAAEGYHCTVFKDSPDAVMMFRRSKEYLGVAGDKSLSNATFNPETLDPDSTDELNFYHIRHKDIPGEATVEKLPRWFKSPRVCAEAAIKRGFNFAAWYEGGCWLYPTVKGAGRLTTGEAKPIGNFTLPIPSAKSSCNSGDRNQWVANGECGLIQELDGCYQCKQLLDYADSVMMLRRSKEYMGGTGDESRYKSEATEPDSLDEINFYHIRHKDIPIDCYRDVEQLSSWFKSPKMCSDAARKRGFNVAVWYRGGCWLKPTKNGIGRLASQDAKPIGNYTLPIPGGKTTCNSHERDRWVAGRECGLIQELDGCYHCKTLVDYQDSVMMLRMSG